MHEVGWISLGHRFVALAARRKRLRHDGSSARRATSASARVARRAHDERDVRARLLDRSDRPFEQAEALTRRIEAQSGPLVLGGIGTRSDARTEAPTGDTHGASPPLAR